MVRWPGGQVAGWSNSHQQGGVQNEMKTSVQTRRVLTLTLLVVALGLAVVTLARPAVHAADAHRASPTPHLVWEGVVVSDQKNATIGGTTIIASTAGVSGVVLEIHTDTGDFITRNTSGTKPERGEHACEFTSLSPGDYVLTAVGLNAGVTFHATGSNLVTIEFRQVMRSTTPTLPPPPPSAWAGRLVSIEENPSIGGALVRVRVVGQSGLAVEIRTPEGDFRTTNWTGTKSELGFDVAEITTLSMGGTYIVEPYNLGVTFQFTVETSGVYTIEFAHVAAPSTVAPRTPRPTSVYPTPTPRPAGPVIRWTTKVNRSTCGADTPLGSSAIIVFVPGRAGSTVWLHSGDWKASQVVGSKPEYGEWACEFGGLTANEYRVEPEGIDAMTTVDVDGICVAWVEFVSYIEDPGLGSKLVWTGRVTRNTSRESQPTGANFSSIVVTVSGKQGLPVRLSTGDWNIAGYTGTKPEHGPFAVEFSTLPGGTYTVEPLGLEATMQVFVDGGGSAVVEFNPELVPVTPPTPSPRPSRTPAAQSATRTLGPTSTLAPTRTPGPTATSTSTPTPPGTPTPTPDLVWTAIEWRNTSEPGKRGGAESRIIVTVSGLVDQPVSIHCGPWTATTYTGTKPEYNPYACEFAGLGPALYTLEPHGLGITCDIYMDGDGYAEVEFALRPRSSLTPTPTP